MKQAPANLAELLEASFAVGHRHVLHRLRDVGRELGLRVALSGGVPRDLCRINLGRLNRERFISELRDIDVVVEGPISQRGGAGVAYSYELRRRLPGDLTINEAFHTATLEVVSDGLSIDITTARREEYPLPGMLPVVDVGGVSIEADLNRRDFSINSLAIELAPDYGKLIDPTGGVGDLRDKHLRVLHGQSFIDDPTRLMRSLRYSMRLDYELEPTTLIMYQQAVDEGVLDHLTPERVRYELECIASEPRWQEIWAVMDLSHLTNSLSRALGGVSSHWKLEDATALDVALRNQPGLLAAAGLAPWLVRTAWAIKDVAVDRLEDSATRLGLFAGDVATLMAARNILALDVDRLKGETRPSVITRTLERHPLPGVVLALFIYQPRDQTGVETRKALRRFVEEYRQVQCDLDGNDLRDLGLEPGPELGQVLAQLRYLRLDGVIKDKAGAVAKARELIAQLKEANSPADEDDKWVT